jgi:uncharacterized LabA/DUF88 family protein
MRRVAVLIDGLNNLHAMRQLVVGLTYFSAIGHHISDAGRIEQDEYDKVLLFSADKDLIPAIRIVKERFPEKQVKFVSTIAYLRPIHATMGRIADGQIRLTPELVGAHLFDF